MKKVLLSVCAVVAGLTANAQEVAVVDGAALGLNDASVTAVAAGTVLGQTANVTMTAAFDDSYKIVNVASNKYNKIKVGGLELSGQGIQGNTNPKTADGANPATAVAAPTGGAVLGFDVKADGYLYVFGKMSSNKNYTVAEEGSLIGYTFAMNTDGTKNLPEVFSYVVTGEGEFNNVTAPILWPETIFLGLEQDPAKADAAAQSGYGVIKFPVFEGCKYMVNACGSKISALGYYYDATGEAAVEIEKEDGTITTLLAAGGTNGINNITSGTVLDENAPIYNLAGQRVSKDTKGILIQNGKKVIK